LDQLLQSFALAYERHDLEAIVRLSDMSNSRLTTVRLMFDHYSTITAHIEDTTMTDEGATALLVITDLIDAKGTRMTPDSILKRTKLRIKKEGDTWTKIVW
jgi:hypothetical protein